MRYKMVQAKTLHKSLDRASNILILLHQDPDGDTIASSLALGTYLRRAGKKVDLAVNGDIPKVFEFLLVEENIKKDFLLGDYDMVIAVDCGDALRTGFPARLSQVCKTKPLINIDHHFQNSLHKIAKINLVDPEASATAEIIFELLLEFKAKIDSKIATYILAGIYYDTGGFQHSNVTGRTLEVISECIRLGGRMNLIVKNISSNKKASALKLWGIALTRMKFKSNGIVCAYLKKEDLQEAGAHPDEASGLVNLLNSASESKLALLLIETPDGKIKASLRTEDDGVDVSKFARLFGGGGHRKAAGFTIEETIAGLIAKT